MSLVYHSTYFSPADHVTFFLNGTEKVCFYVHDILPFLGSLMGRTIRLETRRSGVVIGIHGIESPHFDYMRAMVKVIIRDSGYDYGAVRDIHWQKVYGYNPELYTPSENTARVPQSSDRVVDLRGLLHG